MDRHGRAIQAGFAPHLDLKPFMQEPDWAEASKNLDLGTLLQRAVSPAVADAAHKD